MKHTRLPRFARSSSVSPLRVTDRDREIVKCVHQNRFLRSNHLRALLTGSHQQITRRLQRLYHHGFLDRPPCQIDYYQGGSRPMVYGIGKKGAALLKCEFFGPVHRPEWTLRKKPRRLFLEHALMVSDFMIALETACKRRTDVRLMTLDEIEAVTIPKRDPFRWKVSLGGEIQYGVIPDRVFGLELTNTSGRKTSYWFMLEADRGTMPVKRKSLNASSFYRKLVAYEATWKRKIHYARFGWERFRVLTITTTPQRVGHLTEACQQLKSGHGLFLFTDTKSLHSTPDLFSLNWQTARGTALLVS